MGAAKHHLYEMQQFENLLSPLETAMYSDGVDIFSDYDLEFLRLMQTKYHDEEYPTQEEYVRLVALMNSYGIQAL